MPLSKKRDKARKRIERALAVQPNSNLNPVQPTTPNLSAKPKLPIYNPAIHKPGDKVLVRRGNKWVPYLVPEVDAGGQPIPDYW